MRSGVITHHDKDSRSDKSEQLVWHGEATFVWQRPSEIWKKHEEGTSEHLILFYPFVSEVQKRGGGCGRGLYWMRENNSGSSSNWNLRRSKSVFHVCMQLLPKGRTHLLLQHHFTVHDPPPATQKPQETTIPTNDCLLCWTTDHFAFATLLAKQHHRRPSIANFLVKSETWEISWFPSNPQKFYLWSICISTVLPCTLNSLTLHNLWPNNGTQPKARKWW